MNECAHKHAARAPYTAENNDDNNGDHGSVSRRRAKNE